MTDPQSRTFSFCNFRISRSKLSSSGIIRPQNDKWNHYTGTGCEIYLQLMVKISQIPHSRRSSVFFDAFKKIPYLFFCLYFCLFAFENEFIVRKVRKRWWKPSNDYESQGLIGDPFSQFLEIFYLKISLRSVWIRLLDLLRY